MLIRKIVIAVPLVITLVGPVLADNPRGRTVVSIRGEQFFINGRPTYTIRTQSRICGRPS